MDSQQAQKYFSAILGHAHKLHASDVHLVAGLSPAYRVHGEIVLADAPPIPAEQLREIIYSMLNDVQRATLEHDLELCFSIADDLRNRFRVTIYYHASSPEMAIRRCSADIPTREQLGLPKIVEEFARRRSGLVLVTGPTGVGKTTTLSFMIDLVNSERRCKIVTIEDPIEYIHSHKRAIVIQQELRSDVRSFSAALRNVLRQDPDVIVVGEMRDLETIETALTAAETGHLVLATLHTPNAQQTIERIVSAFPGNQQNQIIAQLSNSLQGVVAQLLLPRADKKGRVLACEILIANSAVRTHIRDNSIHQISSVIQMSKRFGMQSMDMSLAELYERGDISYDMANTHALDSTNIKPPKGGILAGLNSD
ncbi:MAG: PilT/PilU family type 4a pilus ATPase [Candidatus Sumerlaeia bacterium]